MGVRIDRQLAAARLEEAVAWARSDRPVPANWSEATQQMQLAPSISYTPALGTALLARATNEHVDALSIKETYGRDSYSQRTLCHGVLVPGSVRFGFGLRASGREPLNNQPFFRYDHVSEIDRIQSAARPHFDQLKGFLNRINELSSSEALAALAAFVRVRLEIEAATVRYSLENVPLGVNQLVQVVTAFLGENFDRPKRTQALVAAAFDLLYPQVLTRRLNDPSRDFPGDVQGFVDRRVVMAAEIRAKPVPETEARAFVAALSRSNIGRGFIVALHSEHRRLDRSTLSWWAWQEHKVLLRIIEDPDELIREVLAWHTYPLAQALSSFPERVVRRLEEIEASAGSQKRWVVACGDASIDPG